MLDLSASVRLLSRQLLDSLHSLLEDPDSLSLSKPWSTDSVDRAVDKNNYRASCLKETSAAVVTTTETVWPYGNAIGHNHFIVELYLK